jgi:hypothetical protein
MYLNIRGAEIFEISTNFLGISFANTFIAFQRKAKAWTGTSKKKEIPTLKGGFSVKLNAAFSFYPRVPAVMVTSAKTSDNGICFA